MQFAKMPVYYNIGNIYCMFVCVLDAFVVCLSAVAVECYYCLVYGRRFIGQHMYGMP